MLATVRTTKGANDEATAPVISPPRGPREGPLIDGAISTPFNFFDRTGLQISKRICCIRGPPCGFGVHEGLFNHGGDPVTPVGLGSIIDDDPEETCQPNFSQGRSGTNEDQVV